MRKLKIFEHISLDGVILLAQGKRFFSEGTPPRSFDLASTKALSSAIVVNAYKVAGPLKILA
jgi:hypothetical protein